MATESRLVGGPPGVGSGWDRVALELAAQVPPAEILHLWVFPPVRREEREWGTAIVARSGDGDRIRIYTARYMQMVRGRERGGAQVEIAEVAECPLPVVYEVLKGVQVRMAETDPPVDIPPALWYGEGAR